ncbi:B12-binding domain-containing radical SAM protein [Geobacter sp. SVR]|nr:B12-binding domain-containing radical SAM protein [Geobacter sp. SVR]
MPAGACIVAEAAERAGHCVRLLDLMFAGQPGPAVREAVETFRPDIVGLSVRNIDNNDMEDTVCFKDDLLSCLHAVRSRTEAPIVLGGAALGIMPEQLLRLTGALCAVTGVGETVFPLLLERLHNKRGFSDISGIACIKDGNFRRTSPDPGDFTGPCPAPDYRRWLNLSAYRSQQATVPIQTRTGCPFQCVYCSYPLIEGRRCSFRSPAGVAKAVARLSGQGLRDIEFVDSVFNASPEHAMNICRELAAIRHGARLQCLEINPLNFDDALAGAMERAGFTGMGITVESASDTVLLRMRKGFTSREVHHAAEVVRRHDIPCAWIFLLGGPGETRDTLRETLAFAEQRIRPGDVAFFNTGIRIYPGTELESIARREGVLSQPAADMLSPVFYLSPRIDRHWIRQELGRSLAGHMNFINMATLGLSCLPAINRTGSALGLRPPLWRFTRFIRRGLRLAGMDV